MLDKNDQMAGGRPTGNNTTGRNAGTVGSSASPGAASGTGARAGSGNTSSGRSASPGGSQNQGGQRSGSSASPGARSGTGARSGSPGGSQNQGSMGSRSANAATGADRYGGGGRDTSGTGIGGLLGGNRGPTGPNGEARVGLNRTQPGGGLRGPLGPLGQPRTGPSQLDALGLRGLNFTDPREHAVQRLMERGWTLAQARGIVGNLAVESKMNPLVGGDPMRGIGYTARGLAQWRGDRLNALQNEFGAFSGPGKYATSGPSLDAQIDFVDRELRGKSGYADPLAAAVGRGFMSNPGMSTAQAATSFAKSYERPASSAYNSSIGNRIGYGQQIAMNGGVPGVDTSRSGTGLASAVQRPSNPWEHAQAIPNPDQPFNAAAYNGKIQDRLSPNMDMSGYSSPMGNVGSLPSRAPNMPMGGYSSPMAGVGNMPSYPGSMNMAGYQSPMAGVGNLPGPKMQDRLAQGEAPQAPLASQGPGLLASPNINLPGRQPNMNMAGYQSPMASLQGMPPAPSGFRAGHPPNPTVGAPAQVAQGIPGQVGREAYNPLSSIRAAQGMPAQQPAEGGFFAGLGDAFNKAKGVVQAPVNKAKEIGQLAWDNLNNPLLGLVTPPSQETIADRAAHQQIRDTGPRMWTGSEPPQMVAQMQQHVEQVLRQYLAAGVA